MREFALKPKSRLFFVLTTVLFVGFGLLLFVGLNQSPKEIQSALIGKKAANFTINLIQGKDLDSDQDGRLSLNELAGQNVIVNFWASWCVPCRIDLPRVEALHREFSAHGLVVLGVNDETLEKASTFVEDRGFTFPTLADAGGELFRAYEVRTIPTAVIIGRNGKVSSYLVGSHSAEQLREALRKASVE